jgi:hypothetical protein
MSDGPPTPTPINFEIARNNGTTVAIEATNERLQASKIAPTPSLSEIIEQQTRENGRLKEELRDEQRKQGPGLYLAKEVTLALEILQRAMIEYRKLQTEIGEDHRVNR